jgi:hypothetical protein
MRARFEFNPFKLIWRSTPIQFAVDMPLEQALARLQADVRSFRIFKPGVVGYVDTHRIRLSNYSAVRTKGMRPVLDLRVVQDLQGTRLVGCFRNPSITRIMASFWFGGITLIGLAFLVLGPSPPAHDLRNRFIGALVPAVMLVFGMLVLHASQFGWARDESSLAEFVASRVGRIADVTPRSAPAHASAQ